MIRKYLLIGLMALPLLFIISSCQKDTTCKAIITVKDTLGVPVGSVNLRLYSPTTKPGYTGIEQTGVTDASGKASFEFKLEATYSIDASAAGLSGTNTISLKPGETVEKTVVIQ